MNKKVKIKWFNLLLILLLLVFFSMFIFSFSKIIIWNIENKKIDIQVNEVQENSTVEEIKDNSNTIIINKPEKIDENNPYWDYIKMDLINVDFHKLKEQNKDTKGWIQVNGTNINYPFVQASDNNYYLKRSFNKKYNSAGWVFLDYRNNLESINKNTIIYAHGRFDGTMFGSLKNIFSSGWLKNTNNYIIKLSTEYENTLWQVFSTYIIPTTSDYLQIDFSNNQEFLDFANMLLNRSQHDFQTSINENDNILTLSTCYNDDEKVVLHAKLIKKEQK